MDKIHSGDNKAFIDAIRSKGFNPAEFDVTEKGLHLILRYPNTPYLIQIIRKSDEEHKYRIEHTVFDYKDSIVDYKNKFFDVKDIVSLMGDFLNNQLRPYLKERDAPNPWDELKRIEVETFTNVRFDYTDTSEFTNEDKEAIKNGLVDISLLVNEVQAMHETNKLMYEQLKYMNEGLEFLKSEVAKQSKTGFNMVMLTFFTERAINIGKLDEGVSKVLGEKILPFMKQHFTGIEDQWKNLLDQFNQ